MPPTSIWQCRETLNYLHHSNRRPTLDQCGSAELLE